MTPPCTCWPSGGPPCPTHDPIRRSPHHEHGAYCGEDSWDVECCICSDSPCPAVTVEDMRCHRWYDIERERRLSDSLLTPEVSDAPF